MKSVINVLCLSFILFASQITAKVDSSSINIMTFNIQRGSHYNSQVTPVAVSEIVLNNEIDLFGTQELDVAAVKLLCTYLPGYDWFGVGRDDGQETGESVCIVYNTNEFTLLDHSTFWLSETPEVVGSKSWDTNNTRIVTWGKLYRNSDSNIIYMFNTHFDHVSSWAREESSKLLLRKINEIAGKAPVIVTGDFNCTTSSQAYRLLVNYYSDYLQLYDAMYISAAPHMGPTGSYNNFTYDNPTEKIDFIFTNPFYDVMSHEIIPDKYNNEFISDHFPVKIQVKLKFPDNPIVPTLTAVNGNNRVNLYWDSVSQYETRETFNNQGAEVNDFQGYKLYKSKTPDMADAQLIPDSWEIPLLRKTLFECDLDDDIYGYTNYGIVNGFGYFLGDNTGIQNYYIDEDVQNGETYYYVLIAYDNGIPDMADGFPPMESPFSLTVDNNGNIIEKSENVALGKPEGTFPNSYDYLFEYGENNIAGSGHIAVRIIDPSKIKHNTYKISFAVDTLDYHAMLNSKYRSDKDVFFVNSGIQVHSLPSDTIVYSEDASMYSGQNIKLNTYKNYYFLNNENQVVTEIVDGFQLELSDLTEFAELDMSKSGWKNGNSNIGITPSSKESNYFPWNFEIKFGEEYTGLTSTAKSIYDCEGNILAYTQILLNQVYNFTAASKDFPDEKLDMVTYDINMNGIFDPDSDEVLIGYSKLVGNKVYWAGTVCALSFSSTINDMPKAGDVYEVIYKRPFLDSDEFIFDVNPSATGIEDLTDNIYSDFELGQNYPNPFNPSTNIVYRINKLGYYKLVVYNLLGQEVVTLFNGFRPKGEYSIVFNASSLSTGVYVYTLMGEGSCLARKMLLIK